MHRVKAKSGVVSWSFWRALRALSGSFAFAAVFALAAIALLPSEAFAGESPSAIEGAGQELGAVEASPEPAQVATEAAMASDTPSSSGLVRPAIPEGFSVRDMGWLHVAYHPSLAAKVEVLLSEAEAVRADLTSVLGRPVLKKVYVRVGRNVDEMESLAPKGTRFPRYAAGVAYSELGLVLLTATPRFPSGRVILPEVFRHELAHIALHDAVSRDKVPRWFNEGFAVHASREATSARLSTLWTASLSGNLLPFRKLTRSFPADAQTASVAYAQAADLLRFLLRSGEEHRFSALIDRVAKGETFERALQDAYSTDMSALEREWREDVARRYTFWPVIFGGSLIWVGALGLLVWGYARRKARANKKLARWAREEAVEDARKQWAQLVLAKTLAVKRSQEAEATTPSKTEREKAVLLVHRVLPSVEHDGKHHTLH